MVDAPKKELRNVLIGVVAGIILIGMVIMIGNIMKDQKDSECKLSVQSYSSMLKFGSHSEARELAIARQTIKCPAQTIIIRDEERGKKQLADAMKTCWDNFGKGELDLYGRSEGVFCSVCAFVDVEVDKMEGFNEYLITTFVPGTRKTYTEYIAGEVLGNDRLVQEYKLTKAQYPSFDVLESSQEDKYGVYYVYVKGEDALNEFAKRDVVTAGGVVGGTAVAAGGVLLVGVSITKAGGLIAAATSWTGVGVVVGGVIAATGLAVVGGSLLYYNIYGNIPNDDSYWHAQVLLSPFDNETLTKLGCDRIPTAVFDE